MFSLLNTKEIAIRGQFYANLVAEADFREARGVLRGVDQETQAQLLEKAKSDLRSANTSASEPRSLQRFLNRFRNGPLAKEMARPSPDTDERPIERNSQRERRDRQCLAAFVEWGEVIVCEEKRRTGPKYFVILFCVNHRLETANHTVP
jgi:hypothetical protein